MRSITLINKIKLRKTRIKMTNSLLKDLLDVVHKK